MSLSSEHNLIITREWEFSLKWWHSFSSVYRIVTGFHFGAVGLLLAWYKYMNLALFWFLVSWFLVIALTDRSYRSLFILSPLSVYLFYYLLVILNYTLVLLEYNIRVQFVKLEYGLIIELFCAMAAIFGLTANVLRLTGTHIWCINRWMTLVGNVLVVLLTNCRLQNALLLCSDSIFSLNSTSESTNLDDDPPLYRASSCRKSINLCLMNARSTLSCIDEIFSLLIDKNTDILASRLWNMIL